MKSFLLIAGLFVIMIPIGMLFGIPVSATFPGTAIVVGLIALVAWTQHEKNSVKLTPAEQAKRDEELDEISRVYGIGEKKEDK